MKYWSTKVPCLHRGPSSLYHTAWLLTPKTQYSTTSPLHILSFYLLDNTVGWPQCLLLLQTLGLCSESGGGIRSLPSSSSGKKGSLFSLNFVLVFATNYSLCLSSQTFQSLGNYILLLCVCVVTISFFSLQIFIRLSRELRMAKSPSQIRNLILYFERGLKMCDIFQHKLLLENLRPLYYSLFDILAA